MRLEKSRADIGHESSAIPNDAVGDHRADDRKMKMIVNAMQFSEKTPVFSEAEIHRVAGDDFLGLSQTTNLVSEPKVS